MSMIVGFLLGCLFMLGIIRLEGYLQLEKLKDEQNSVYNEIIDLIGTKSMKFIARYNNNVTFRVSTKSKGVVDMIVFFDKKDLGLFDKGDCVLTTQNADRKIITDICQKLEDTYEKDLKDCVQIMGNIVDRKTISRLNPNINFPSAFPEERIEEPQFTIDDILDRINQVGMDKLTQDEKNFLDQYQKNQK